MRSVTGLPDDMDRAYGPEEPPSRFSYPPDQRMTAAETAAEIRRICGQALDAMRGMEYTAHRCKHGLNTDTSACGTCMREDEELGVALAARFEGEQR